MMETVEVFICQLSSLLKDHGALNKMKADTEQDVYRVKFTEVLPTKLAMLIRTCYILR